MAERQDPPPTDDAPNAPARMLDLGVLTFTGLAAVITGLLAIGALTGGHGGAAAFHGGATVLLVGSALWTWRRGAAVGVPPVLGLLVAAAWSFAVGIFLLTLISLVILVLTLRASRRAG